MVMKDLEIKAKIPKALGEDAQDEDENDFEIDMEDDEDEDLEVSMGDDDEDIEDEEEPEDKPKAKDEEDDEDEDIEEAPRGSRENDRIRTLVEQRNKEREERKKDRDKTRELEKKLIETQKATVATNKALLEKNIKFIKSSLVKAQEAGEHETQVNLQEELNKSQLDLAALNSWKEPVLPEADDDDIEEFEEPKQTQQDAINTAPKATRKWLKNNEWFTNPKSKKDARKQKEAIAYSKILVEDEGLSLEDEELYQKVDERLEMLGLASSDKDSVKSGGKSSNSEEGRKTRKKISQTVQGVSRTSASRSNSSPKTYVLTAEQRKIADLYGIPYKEFAKEAAKLERAEKAGQRMVEIEF